MHSIEQQMRIITKGVTQIASEEALREKLEIAQKEKRPLRIKLGLDPSAPDIHLGHAVVLRKIKQMQDLGHEAHIIIGDFTGKIGDPSGKAKGRVALTDEQVKTNAQTYFEQIFKVLDKEKTIVRYNSEWLNKLNFEDVLKLAATTTVARIMERDDFQKRYNENTPIGIHEFFYPLMQAYDSIELKADIELGGTDQTFNVLMGRTLQKHVGMDPQVAMFMPLLEGLDGVEKMSKSLGNYIGVYEPAEIMFKKIMEVPDQLIIKYYELATDLHPDEIDTIKTNLENGKNPRDVKYHLAQAITKLYHDEASLKQAMHYYDQAFTKKNIPDTMPELTIHKNATLETLASVLVAQKYVSSKSELRRLVQSSGVQINSIKVSALTVTLNHGDVLKIGKKAFLRLISK